MELSKRLQAVVNLMPPMDTVCDVGCDHGYVAITFIQNKTAGCVIAMDVNAGPLEQARKNAALFGVTDRLDFRLSDGLAKVKPGEADAFLCAGMGGRLMVRIMTEGRDVMNRMKGAVLQPQSELAFVRRHIYEAGWHIVKEDMVFEEDSDTPAKGIYYPMMYIEPGKEPMPEEAALTYGPMLLKEQHPVLRQFLEYSLEQKEKLVMRLQNQTSGGQAQARVQELLGEIEVIHNLLQ